MGVGGSTATGLLDLELTLFNIYRIKLYILFSYILYVIFCDKYRICYKTCTPKIEISTGIPQKHGAQSTSRYLYLTVRHIPKEYFIRPQEHLLNYDHCGFIPNTINWKPR